MPIMQKLPFVIRCQHCHWMMSESSDAIELPSSCPRCGQSKFKYETNTQQSPRDYLLPKNTNPSRWFNYLKRLFGS